MIEFTKVRMDHIHWAEEITQALKKGKLPEVTSFKECDFGQWLHTDGIDKYGHIHEISELASKHKAFHQTVSDMIATIESRDYDKAEILLGEFRRESQSLIFLLSLVEYRLYKKKL